MVFILNFLNLCLPPTHTHYSADPTDVLRFYGSSDIVIIITRAKWIINLYNVMMLTQLANDLVYYLVMGMHS